MFAFVRRHRAATAVVALIAAATGIFLLLWFQPWKLFVDETVDEAAPGLVTSASPSPGASSGATELSTGTFRSLEHETKGRARIIRLADGSRVVRLEDFRTSNGPDLILMLSDTPATEDGWRVYDDGEVVNLGKLKGNIGNQNYTIPAGVDLSKYRSVVVWCRRFTVGFGSAPIMLA